MALRPKPELAREAVRAAKLELDRQEGNLRDQFGKLSCEFRRAARLACRFGAEAACTLRALSRCADLESELLGDCTSTTRLAHSLGAEQAFDDYEASIFNERIEATHELERMPRCWDMGLLDPSVPPRHYCLRPRNHRGEHRYSPEPYAPEQPKEATE